MMTASQLISAALLAAIICCALSIAHARPQQFSRPVWNQFPNSQNQWNAPNPQNPFFQQQQQQQQGPNSNSNSSNNNNNGNTGVSSTTPVPATATTASPQFLACMQRCGTTMEYNPVCGSDGINYHNNGRLSCAVRCGKTDVVATRMGTCSAL